jgi:hypothetical protein
MRYLFGFMCVLALGVMPMVGCVDFDLFEDGCEGMVCDDDNECTEDGCSSWGVGSLGCHSDPVDEGTACDFDGLAGVCIDGVCCDVCERDGNECTRDCNPATGTCDYISVEDGTNCDDGNDNECTYDTCIDGACTGPGRWVTDGTVCDFDGGAGLCIDGVCEENLCAGVVCDDDNECTEELCDYVDGTCHIVGWVSGFPCVGPFVGDGMCIDGVCVPPCDPTSEEEVTCPLGYDRVCCPGSEFCTVEC